jgi:FtsH-binding integral membrane protein
MAYSPDFRAYPRASAATTAAVLDAGLRAYMLRVYNWMASGLLLTGVVAYLIANTSLINAFYPLVQTPFGYAHQPTALAMIAMFAPLAFVLVLSLGVNKLSTSAAQALFWVLRGDGRQPDEHFPGLHQRIDRAGVLHHGRHLRRDQPLWLHGKG